MVNVPTDSPEGLRPNAVKAYLQRLGVAPKMVEAPNLELLAHLQRAHLTTIPFETLAITGDPYGEWEGEGIVLAVPHLYTKIVERERGGYCFGINGLFCALLTGLGYDVHRAAARVASALRIPANHLVNVVELDRRYVVDVGTGPPAIWAPLPLDGTSRTDEVGVTWRVAASERPDAAYRTEYRRHDDPEWTVRYVFEDEPPPCATSRRQTTTCNPPPNRHSQASQPSHSPPRRATGSSPAMRSKRRAVPTGTTGR